VILLSGNTFWIDEAWLTNRQPIVRDLSTSLTEPLENQEKKIIEDALGLQAWNSALNPGRKDSAVEYQ
jgi:hypothetical protein